MAIGVAIISHAFTFALTFIISMGYAGYDADEAGVFMMWNAKKLS